MVCAGLNKKMLHVWFFMLLSDKALLALYYPHDDAAVYHQNVASTLVATLRDIDNEGKYTLALDYEGYD